jgi:serine/threonine protein kinase
MWSVGVVAAYMWCGHVPTGLDDDELNCTPEGLLAVLLGACAAAGCDLPHDPEEESYPPPDGLLQLMVGCLAKDPSQRLSAQQLLRMPWFEQERGQMLYNASQRPASASGSYGVALEALLESWKAQ